MQLLAAVKTVDADIGSKISPSDRERNDSPIIEYPEWP